MDAAPSNAVAHLAAPAAKEGTLHVPHRGFTLLVCFNVFFFFSRWHQGCHLTVHCHRGHTRMRLHAPSVRSCLGTCLRALDAAAWPPPLWSSCYTRISTFSLDLHKCLTGPLIFFFILESRMACEAARADATVRTYRPWRGFWDGRASDGCIRGYAKFRGAWPPSDGGTRLHPVQRWPMFLGIFSRFLFLGFFFPFATKTPLPLRA